MTEAVTSPLDGTDALAHALYYRSLGWRVLALHPASKEARQNGWTDSAFDDEDVHTWWGEHSSNNIAIVTGPVSGIIVVDIDPAKGGDETWADLEGAYGPFPDTVEAITAGPMPGRHLIYQYPDLPNGQEIPSTSDSFRTSDGAKLPGVDIRAVNGYIAVAPSVHPDTGARYEWEASSRAGEVAVAPFPQVLANNLVRQHRDLPAEAGEWTGLDPTFARDRFIAEHADNQKVADILQTYGWHSPQVQRDGTIRLTRPGKARGIGASIGRIRPGHVVCFTSNAPPLEDRGYDPFQLYATIAHDGDYATADEALMAANGGAATYAIDWAELEAWVDREHAAAVARRAETDGRHIPEAFWGAHPTYDHIRLAARARLVAPDAVLASVLTRVAAATPHIVEIPGIVGAPVGLTYYAALVGPPETGKSAAAAVAAEMLRVNEQKVRDRVPIGSGEGFVEILYGMVPDPDNPKKQVRAQTHNAAIFHIDEGAVLTDLGARSGSTLLPTLRTAFTHGTLGNANASAERRRILKGSLYVYGVTMGIQPELAGPLLDDAAGGTPQRFLWVQTTDPAAPDTPPEWPGPLEWAPPPPPVLERHETASRDGYRRVEMSFAPEIVEVVRAERRGVVRGTSIKKSMEAHATLVRLKTAALLALLEMDMDVTWRHWELAGIVCAASTTTRQAVEATLQGIRQGAETAAASRQARIQTHVADATESEILSRAARIVAKVVRRHRDEGKCAEGCADRCITHALGQRYRVVVSADQVTDEATSRGWIARRAGRWEVGMSMPTE